jgi:hypothetical protein
MAFANSPHASPFSSTTTGNGDAEIVNEIPGQNPQRPIILPKVAFNSSTTLESPAFWFCFGMLAAFAVVYVLRK